MRGGVEVSIKLFRVSLSPTLFLQSATPFTLLLLIIGAQGALCALDLPKGVAGSTHFEERKRETRVLWFFLFFLRK